MAPKQQQCTSYRYVLTPYGGKFIQVPDQQSKDEESPADYNPGGYLPVQVGDTFKHGRYKVLRKLGFVIFFSIYTSFSQISLAGVISRPFGSSKTGGMSHPLLLQLSSDPRIRLNRHSAIKVVKSATRYAETAIDEIKLLSQISCASPSHPGLDHIVSFLDSFSHTPTLSQSHLTPTQPLNPLRSQPQGHICIVFEPLGESLLALISRHKQKGVPRALAKYIAKQILLGLTYLHDECDLVHTDIKPENICCVAFHLTSFSI
jgi:serine/threonine protein kinase